MSRKKKNIILCISNQGVFFNENLALPWKNTNFPAKDSFVINERKPIYWDAEMLDFDKQSKHLKLNIISYSVQNISAFNQQTPKHPINSITFDPLDWSKLQEILSFYLPEAFKSITKPVEEIAATSLAENNFLNIANLSFSDHAEERIESIEISVEHPIIKAVFKNGYVEITKRIKGIKGNTTITIENQNIIAEFDHIKPFFAKALNTRTLEITGTITVSENGETTSNCQSPQISSINENLISTVRSLQLRDHVFTPKITAVDKSLFTPDEFLDQSDELLGNALRKSEQDLLENILELTGIRNRKQLVYLSGKLHNSNTALKFTLSPKFGFLFHAVGEQMDHFIWELLNSHATYVWSIPKNKLSTIKKYQLLEREINFIREHGRNLYLNSDQSSEFIFNKINHNNANSNLIDGFPKWKIRINECLI